MRKLTSEESHNCVVSERWEELFNVDVERMCDECYAEDCVTASMATGQRSTGREHLRRIERGILAAYPDRRLSITNRIVAGDVVVVEGTWQGTAVGEAESTLVNICVVLTFRGGYIVDDRTYAPSGATDRQHVMDTILRAAASG